jgi:hypothetical protein
MAMVVGVRFVEGEGFERGRGCMGGVDIASQFLVKFRLVKWRSLKVGYKPNALLMDTIATLGQFEKPNYVVKGLTVPPPGIFPMALRSLAPIGL